MGRPKKNLEKKEEDSKPVPEKKEEIKKPIPEKKEKWRCIIERQYRDFDTQKEAREMMKKCLATDEIFFCSLIRSPAE